jgi:hypothetical protein
MCTQTENIGIDTVTQTDIKEDLDQMIKVIQQFKSEKEKFKVKPLYKTYKSGIVSRGTRK